LIDFYQNVVKAEVRHMWGMTELSPNGCFGTIKGSIADRLSREEQDKLKLTQGRPHIFCEYRLVDDTNSVVPHDGKSPGNLQVRGPTAVKRYFKMQEDCVHPGNWFDTGDIATIDGNGYMLIRDRSKDVIKSGGEWISSIEIENLVAGHPGVSEAAVVAISHAKWGERPLLVVVRSRAGRAGVHSVTKEDLLRHLDGTIASWWMPDDVVFVDEMPHTATGKIQKLQLRQQFKDLFQPATGSGVTGSRPSGRLPSKL
jgi:fatty-acyl-CoA synthase